MILIFAGAQASYADEIPEGTFGLTIENGGYPTGENMSRVDDTFDMAIDLSMSFTFASDSVKEATPAGATLGAITYQWVKSEERLGTYTEFESLEEIEQPLYIRHGMTMEGELNFRLNFPDVDGYWIKCIFTDLNGQTYETLPVHCDTVGDYWGDDYFPYITNGTIGYRYCIYGDEKYFDIVGKKGDDPKWYSSTYDNDGWGVESAFIDGDDERDGYVDRLRFTFSSANSHLIDVHATLSSDTNAISLSSDVMIGGSDGAPITIVRDSDDNIVQLQMVETDGPLEEADKSSLCMVLSTKERHADRSWIGYYYNRVPFVSNYNIETMGASFDPITGFVYQVQGGNTEETYVDSGATISWLNVEPGSTVDFSYSIGNVTESGASLSARLDSDSKSITVGEVVDGAHYQLQKYDEATSTWQVQKLKYNQDKKAYVVDSFGDEWIVATSEENIVISDLEQNTRFKVLTYSAEEYARMISGETVVPGEDNISTAIDPVKQDEGQDPIEFKCTLNSITAKNLSRDFTYNLIEDGKSLVYSEYFAPDENGEVLFDELETGTLYYLIARSTGNTKTDQVPVWTHSVIYVYESLEDYFDDGTPLKVYDDMDQSSKIENPGSRTPQSDDVYFAGWGIFVYEDYCRAYDYSEEYIPEIWDFSNDIEGNMILFPCFLHHHHKVQMEKVAEDSFELWCTEENLPCDFCGKDNRIKFTLNCLDESSKSQFDDDYYYDVERSTNYSKALAIFNKAELKITEFDVYTGVCGYWITDESGNEYNLIEGRYVSAPGKYKMFLKYHDITISTPFEITEPNISLDRVNLNTTYFKTNGTDTCAPEISVVGSFDGELIPLEEGTHYEVTGVRTASDYGDYEIIVTGKGICSGTLKKAWHITANERKTEISDEGLSEPTTPEHTVTYVAADTDGLLENFDDEEGDVVVTLNIKADNAEDLDEAVLYELVTGAAVYFNPDLTGSEEDIRDFDFELISITAEKKVNEESTPIDTLDKVATLCFEVGDSEWPSFGPYLAYVVTDEEGNVSVKELRQIFEMPGSDSIVEDTFYVYDGYIYVFTKHFGQYMLANLYDSGEHVIRLVLGYEDKEDRVIFGDLDDLELPTPVREGYYFDGWFIDEDCRMDFMYNYLGDMVLYAKWSEKPAEDPTDDPQDDPQDDDPHGNIPVDPTPQELPEDKPEEKKEEKKLDTSSTPVVVEDVDDDGIAKIDINTEIIEKLKEKSAEEQNTGDKTSGKSGKNGKSDKTDKGDENTDENDGSKTKSGKEKAAQKEPEESDVIVINLSGINTDINGVEMSGEALSSLADVLNNEEDPTEYVMFVLDNATVKIDKNTMNTLVEDSKGEPIKLVVVETKPKELSEVQKASFGKQDPDLTFEAFFEVNGERIHNFNGGEAEVSLEFKPEKGKDVSHYHVYYVSPDGELELYHTRYEAGKFVFRTTHFSDFALLYDVNLTNETFESLELTDRMQLNSKFSVKAGKKNVTVKWGEVEGADGYTVFANYCGRKGYETIADVSADEALKVNFNTLAGKKLRTDKCYKVYVSAYKMVDGKRVVVATSITAHVAGVDEKDESNVKKVKVSKKMVEMSLGEKHEIKASLVLEDDNLEPMPDEHVKQFRYGSSNKSVVRVTKSGKIKAVGKGVAVVRVYAHNGVSKEITVVVR